MRSRFQILRICQQRFQLLVRQKAVYPITGKHIQFTRLQGKRGEIHIEFCVQTNGTGQYKVCSLFGRVIVGKQFELAMLKPVDPGITHMH